MSKKITTHSKILKLRADGLKVSEIAKKLNIRYQHAYNSLKRQDAIDLRDKAKNAKKTKKS